MLTLILPVFCSIRLKQDQKLMDFSLTNKRTMMPMPSCLVQIVTEEMCKLTPKTF
jgi:hypothetical protein